VANQETLEAKAYVSDMAIEFSPSSETLSIRILNALESMAATSPGFGTLSRDSRQLGPRWLIPRGRALPPSH